MSKWGKKGKLFFISIVILIIYIPLFFVLVFSFNEPSRKGQLSFDTWNGATFNAYRDLFNSNHLIAFANSTIIAFSTVLIVTTLSLLTVFSLWRQKNKALRIYTETTNNIPIINPDIITAVGLAIVMTIAFGSLAADDEGLGRAIISHVVMTLPYSILIMYPRSEKFNATLFKASYDLGYGKIRTWFKTYFIFMLVPMLFSIIVTVVFSFDDFILARITSNVETIGVQLFAGQFQPWALALGSLLLIFVILGNVIYISLKIKSNRTKIRHSKKMKKIESKFLDQAPTSLHFDEDPVELPKPALEANTILIKEGDVNG